MATYKLNDTKMFADVTDGIAIIINSETGIYYGMNGLGTAVYENIEKGADTNDILKALKSMSGAPATLEDNFKQFIDVMIDKEVLVNTSAQNVAVNIDETVAKEDEFALVIKEYDDAQELLLADPIHEVKEETGWTPEKDSIGYSKEETAEREKKMER